MGKMTRRVDGMEKKLENQGMNERIWTLAFVELFLINSLSSLGHFMMNTLMPRYAEQLGASPSTVGVVASAFAITALAVRPVVGPATTSFRNNRLFAAGNAIILASFLIYLFSYNVPTLIVGRLLQGIGMGFLAPVSMAMVSEVLPPSKFASGIGIFSLGQAIAMAVGPSAGLAVVERFGYGGLFVFGAALVGLSVILSLMFKSKEPERNVRFHITLDNFVAKEVWVPTVMMFFLSGAQATIQSFILIYAGLGGVEQIGLFFTVYAVCLLISRPVCGRVADRFGMDKMIVPGILVYALAFVVISFARTLPMFLLAGVLAAFGYGICQPLLQTLCMKMVPNDRRGVASNTNYIGVDIGFFLMPIIAGWIVTLLAHVGDGILTAYSVMYQVMLIPLGVALAVFLVKGKKMRAFF